MHIEFNKLNSQLPNLVGKCLYFKIGFQIKIKLLNGIIFFKILPYIYN